MGRKGRRKRYFISAMDKAIEKPPRYGACPECHDPWAVGTIKDHSGEIHLQCKYCKGNFQAPVRAELFTATDINGDWTEREYFREVARSQNVILPYDFKAPVPAPQYKPTDFEKQRAKKHVTQLVGLPPCTVPMKFLSMSESIELANKVKQKPKRNNTYWRNQVPSDGVGEVRLMTNNNKDLGDYMHDTGGDKVRARLLLNSTKNKKKVLLKRNGQTPDGPSRINAIYSRPRLSPTERAEAGRVEKSHHLTLLAGQ